MLFTQHMYGAKYAEMVIWGTKWVAMARHRLTLSQDAAASLRNIFRYLPGLWNTIFDIGPGYR